MTTYLSAKQDAFARSLAEGASQAESYRTAYRPRPTTSEKSIHQMASRIAASIKVRSRISELYARAEMRALEHHGVCTDSLLAEADQAYRIATQKSDPSGMAVAIRLKARLAGLLAKERDNTRDPLAGLPDESIRSELARLRAE